MDLSKVSECTKSKITGPVLDMGSRGSHSLIYSVFVVRDPGLCSAAIAAGFSLWALES